MGKRGEEKRGFSSDESAEIKRKFWGPRRWKDWVNGQGKRKEDNQGGFARKIGAEGSTSGRQLCKGDFEYGKKYRGRRSSISYHN